MADFPTERGDEGASKKGTGVYRTATLGTRAVVGETRSLHWQTGQTVSTEG